MSKRGRSSISSPDPDSTDIPIGSNQETLVAKLIDIFLDHDEMRMHLVATAAMLTELIRIVGTPAFILIFLQFLREVDLARKWLGSSLDGHPHDLINDVPLRKEGSYKSCDFSAVRMAMSNDFSNRCDSFYAVLAFLQNKCAQGHEDQLFRYLCEVQVLLDMLVACIR